VDPTLAEPDLYRSTWTLPLAFSRRDPSVLYFANQRLFRTADAGRHWEPISPDLTRESPGAPANLDPTTAADAPRPGPRKGVIYAIAPSRLVDGDIWVGTDDGLVYRTRDEGRTWTNITPAPLTAWSKVGILETSPFDAESAYAAVDRHRLDDFHPYVYRTRDGGRSWTLAVAGIPQNEAVNVVRADPQRRGLLYAGTERGVHVSFDDGDHWQSLQANLPVSSVRDIEVHGDDVVVATHGRGFWIMDDVTPLRQAADLPPATSAWLYRPAVARRVRGHVWEGTPFPKDEPMARNPPDGAYLDYVLGTPPAGPVVVEIEDGSGHLVRRYSSAVEPVPFDIEKTRVSPHWWTAPATLGTTPGMHRFVWPLRYAPPPELAKGDAYASGVWAPPGEYKVTLEVDGRRQSQTLTVAPDPRVQLAEDAYRQQFTLAREVEQMRAAAAVGSEAATNLTGKLAAARQTATRSAGAAIGTLEARAWELRGVEASADRRSPSWNTPHSTASWLFLTQTLDDLARAIDGADAAPTPDARSGVALARRALERLQGLQAGLESEAGRSGVR
jgi:hypothetical protein